MILDNFSKKIGYVYLLEFIFIGLQPVMFYFISGSPFRKEIPVNFLIIFTIVMSIINAIMILLSPNYEFKKGSFISLMFAYTFVLACYCLSLNDFLSLIVGATLNILLIWHYWKVFNQHSYIKEKRTSMIYFFEFCVVSLQLLLPIIYATSLKTDKLWIFIFFVFLFCVFIFGLVNVVTTCICSNNEFKKGAFILQMTAYLIATDYSLWEALDISELLPILAAHNIINGILILLYFANFDKYKDALIDEPE